MGLDQDFNIFARDSREFQGEVRAWIKNISEHITAVSHKADDIRDDLEDHKESPNAHGSAASSRAISMIATWSGVILSLASLGIMAIKLNLTK